MCRWPDESIWIKIWYYEFLTSFKFKIIWEKFEKKTRKNIPNEFRIFFYFLKIWLDWTELELRVSFTLKSIGSNGLFRLVASSIRLNRIIKNLKKWQKSSSIQLDFRIFWTKSNRKFGRDFHSLIWLLWFEQSFLTLIKI